jgi:hypothetical protein
MSDTSPEAGGPVVVADLVVVPTLVAIRVRGPRRGRVVHLETERALTKLLEMEASIIVAENLGTPPYSLHRLAPIGRKRYKTFWTRLIAFPLPAELRQRLLLLSVDVIAVLGWTK